MAVTDYNTAPALNTALFPEGMARRDVNDNMRVVQADIRSVVNDLPFFDVGTGAGAATYAFVSTNSFNVLNTDVTAFYTIGRRLKVVSGTIGTRFGTVSSSSFSAANTTVVVDMDGGVALVNEALSVQLSVVDVNGNPAASSSDTLTLTSTDAGALALPTFEMFRDSASPAVDDEIGKVAFTGRDSSAVKITYGEVLGIIRDPTDGSEDSSLVFRVMRNGDFEQIADMSFGRLRLESRGDGAASGPEIDLLRESASPAVADELGDILFTGRDSAGSKDTYARVHAKIVDPTSGAEEGGLDISLLQGGVLTQVLDWSSGRANFKTTARVEGGGGFIPFIVNTTSTGGTLVQFRQNDVAIGSISFTGGGVVSYNTFTGSHWSEFQDKGEVDPPEGTLLSTVDAWHVQDRGLPRVEITKEANCKRIYGVFGGRDHEGEQIHVFSVGTAPKVRCIGPISAGDLLTASEVPGVATRQAEDVFRSSTLGKALVTDLRVGERLIAANIMAG